MPESPKLTRKPVGSLIAEAAISSFLTIVIGAIAADITILNLAFMNLDKTTRDCARVAGSVTPTGTQTYAQAALLAAQTELKNHATDGYFCQQPQLLGNALVLYQDWSGAPYYGQAPAIPGSSPTTYETPYLTVACTEVVRMPIPIPFFGANIEKFTSNGTLTFARQYSFPIVRTNFSPTNNVN